MPEVQLHRDPFARQTLMRKIETKRPCKWCGGDARFHYGWESDRIRRTDVHYEGPFCSMNCYKAFNS